MKPDADGVPERTRVLTAANNTVILVGNLTRDPEVRFQLAGRAKLVVGLAVDRRWQDPDTAQWQETTSFLDVVCWGDLAVNVSRSAKRGNRVVVTGRIDQRTWKAKGVARSKIEIVADDVALSLRWVPAPAEASNGATRQASEG